MGSENIPYGKQWVCDDDVAAVVETLRSDWLTTGPRVGEFEKAFAECVGARDAVAVNSGTAALHAAMFAVGVGPGDEVIVPAMTFAASANAVVYQGATPFSPTSTRRRSSWTPPRWPLGSRRGRRRS